MTDDPRHLSKQEQTNVAQQGIANPMVVGWMVGSSDSPAMYNVHERERAFEAASRWNAPIVELIVNPSAAAALSDDSRLPTSNLITRLRALAQGYPTAGEAADEIERLRMGLESLKQYRDNKREYVATIEMCAYIDQLLSGDSSAPHDALRTDDDPLKPPVEGPSQVETPKPSKNESVRQKFDAWYASPHGEAEFTLGMHYFGWAYTSYAAGYKQAALDLGRSLPVETPKPSKEESYRNALAEIRQQTRSDPADLETAMGSLRSIYDITNMALFAGGAGFTSPIETKKDELREIYNANVKDLNEELCREQGHVFLKVPVKECLRCHARFAQETSPSPGANLCHWARCHQPKAPGEAFLCAEHAWQRDNGTLPNPDYDTSEADAPKSGAWPVVSAEEAKHPLAFRHWSKDPAIPYPGCHCATCSAQKASACVHEWEDGWCAKCGKKFGEKLSGPLPDRLKALVKAGDQCPAIDDVHTEHQGKCVYCGAPMSSQSKASEQECRSAGPSGNAAGTGPVDPGAEARSSRREVTAQKASVNPYCLQDGVPCASDGRGGCLACVDEKAL